MTKYRELNARITDVSPTIHPQTTSCEHRQVWYTSMRVYCVEVAGTRRWLARCLVCGRQTEMCATYNEPLRRAEIGWWRDAGRGD